MQGAGGGTSRQTNRKTRSRLVYPRMGGRCQCFWAGRDSASALSHGQLRPRSLIRRTLQPSRPTSPELEVAESARSAGDKQRVAVASSTVPRGYLGVAQSESRSKPSLRAPRVAQGQQKRLDFRRRSCAVRANTGGCPGLLPRLDSAPESYWRPDFARGPDVRV